MRSLCLLPLVMNPEWYANLDDTSESYIPCVIFKTSIISPRSLLYFRAGSIASVYLITVQNHQDSHFLTKPAAYLFLFNASLLHSLYSTKRASTSSLMPMDVSDCSSTKSRWLISWRNLACRLCNVSSKSASAIILLLSFPKLQTFPYCKTLNTNIKPVNFKIINNRQT